MPFASLYEYVVDDEGSLLPICRDCTSPNGFELYIYIYICPFSDIHHDFNKVKQIDRHKLLSHTPKQQHKNICLITKFSLKIDHFIQSVKYNYSILKDDGMIGGIFVQPPIYTSKQPPSLRQLLIRNTITDDEPECNKQCGKHRCNVCRHINTATKVLIHHKTVKPGNNNCDSANVVYLIHCQKMPRSTIYWRNRRKFQIQI